MKITITQYLNARIGSASVNAPVKYYKSPGDVIDIDNVCISDDIEGNAIWYHCAEDLCYYWSGGIAEAEFGLAGADLGTDPVKAMLVLAEAKSYFWRKYREALPALTGLVIEDAPNYVLTFQCPDPARISIPAILHYKGFAIHTKVITAPNSVFHFPALGQSISRAGLNEWGSCGVHVKGTTAGNAGDYVLTNFHVAAADLLAAKVYTFSFLAGGGFKFCNMPSWLEQAKPENKIGWLYSGLFDEWHDVAMIRISPQLQLPNITFDGKTINGHLDVFNMAAYRGKAVALFGAKSGKKDGVIQSVNAAQKFELGAETYYKDNLIQISNFSDHGDSGCPVLLGEQLIGLLIGSDTLSSYVLPIQRIFNYFNLQL